MTRPVVSSYLFYKIPLVTIRASVVADLAHRFPGFHVLSTFVIVTSKDPVVPRDVGVDKLQLQELVYVSSGYTVTLVMGYVPETDTAYFYEHIAGVIS